MTEAYEDDFLVRVRAQVMARDESTEGWLPLQGGGLANVSIRKRARLPPDGGGHEYIIYGQRISDQTVILSCVINRDLQYFKVMPTFHHWRAGKQRNGLTFQTAADARAFDKGIIRAYDDLIDVLNHHHHYLHQVNGFGLCNLLCNLYIDDQCFFLLFFLLLTEYFVAITH
ncbi:sprouty-related, EVH1 domain-containing protein 1-like isoform X2 [Uranotaenia lowii]|uniref:sprouty-related, EVH1 domain-containing protein 1-like isoform X2 n=1 Tax=Uranotaenia lowii TaxID=190385 RepID=UPI0024787FA5|nr:sprouty-related, EVH1 domain-containing protein 1-like isoform X2 [Uranotaenia lowii]